MSTVKSRWEKLNGSRQSVLERARDCADLTIPSLCPPEGHTEDADLPQPYQSLGARGLNNLASKLSIALIPAGNPFFRLRIEDDVLAELSDKTAMEENLRKIENRAMKLVESSKLRVAVHMALKQLELTGNSMLYMPDAGGARTFRLNQYCVVRDAMGEWHEIVIREAVHPTTIDEDVARACEVDQREDNDENVEVFTFVQRKGNKAEWFQEINKKEVPDSKGRTSYAECPYIPLRWTAVENEHYGRGHVEEYLGDLRSLEGLTKALVLFAAVASKIIFLEQPNSSTDLEQLNAAVSGEFVTGNIDDIAVLQADKYADFQVTKATVDDITLRLSHAFLLTTGTVRNAERVTAEEIRMQAQELEDVLGGVYTVLSQEMQLPIVRRLLAQLRKNGDMPPLPAGLVEPVVVTGFDALGRGHELNKYRAYFADGRELFGDTFLAQFDQTKVAKIMATHHNVDIADIQKSPAQMQQDQADQMGGTIVEKAAGPVAGQLAGAAAQSMIPTEE